MINYEQETCAVCLHAQTERERVDGETNDLRADDGLMDDGRRHLQHLH
jgi:hypothetical protein